MPLQLWEQSQRIDVDDGPVRRTAHTREYLQWYYSVTRVSVKLARNNDPIEDRLVTDEDDDIVDEYDD